MKEFNLSKKQLNTNQDELESNVLLYYYPEQDVREFIKRLKAKVRDEINNPYTQKPTVHLGIVLKWINELAGEKLK